MTKRENKRDTLRGLLIFLGRLMDDKSHLSPLKRNAAIAEAARIEARGWKYLAGESAEDIDELIAAVGDQGTATLLRNRKDSAPGRREGSRAKSTAVMDAAIMSEIDSGAPIAATVRKHDVKIPQVTQRRIEKLRADRKKETRRIIALQTKS